MTQVEIDHAVAQATGESIAEVRRRGFVLAMIIDPRFDPEPRTGPRTDDNSTYDIETHRSNDRDDDW